MTEEQRKEKGIIIFGVEEYWKDSDDFEYYMGTYKELVEHFKMTDEQVETLKKVGYVVKEGCWEVWIDE